MEHGAPLQRRTTLSSRSRSAASVRRAGPMCPAAAHAFPAGHASPALQGTGRVRADRVVRPCTPCHCEPVRAAKQVPLGYRLARQSVFPTLAPLDKPVGMGIIVDVRGRCDKRSAPLRESFNEPYGSQKPSLVGVAVFVFQLHNTNRNGIPPDVESKYPVHVCHPLSGL